MDSLLPRRRGWRRDPRPARSLPTASQRRCAGPPTPPCSPEDRRRRIHSPEARRRQIRTLLSRTTAASFPAPLPHLLPCAAAPFPTQQWRVKGGWRRWRKKGGWRQWREKGGGIEEGGRGTVRYRALAFRHAPLPLRTERRSRFVTVAATSRCWSHRAPSPENRRRSYRRRLWGGVGGAG